MNVTEEHLRFYEEEGYVVLEGALTKEDLEPIIQDYTAVVDEKARELHSEGKIENLYADEPFESRMARVAEEARDDQGSKLGNLDIGATRAAGHLRVPAQQKSGGRHRAFHRTGDQLQRRFSHAAEDARRRGPLPPGCRVHDPGRP